MLKANMLVDKFLTQPVWIKYVSVIFVSVVECYLKSPS